LTDSRIITGKASSNCLLGKCDEIMEEYIGDFSAEDDKKSIDRTAEDK